jgi:hypothetical protein
MSYKFETVEAFEEVFAPIFERVAKAEGTVRKNMDPLARAVGGYILLSNDSRPLNRVMEKLSPANRRLWALFWQAHSPFVAEKDKKTKEVIRFGKLAKNDDIRNKKLDLLDKWVDCDDASSDYGYTIWQWHDDNTETKVTVKDYVSAIGRNIQYALHGDKKGNGQAPVAAVARELLEAINHSEELSLEMLMEFQKAHEEAQALEAKVLQKKAA